MAVHSQSTEKYFVIHPIFLYTINKFFYVQIIVFVCFYDFSFHITMCPFVYLNTSFCHHQTSCVITHLICHLLFPLVLLPLKLTAADFGLKDHFKQWNIKEKRIRIKSLMRLVCCKQKWPESLALPGFWPFRNYKFKAEDNIFIYGNSFPNSKFVCFLWGNVKWGYFIF